MQRDLARTLLEIAENPQSFYTGDIARAFASYMAKNGGIITLEDLKNYTPIWRNPVCGNFRTYEICAMSLLFPWCLIVANLKYSGRYRSQEVGEAKSRYFALADREHEDCLC